MKQQISPTTMGVIVGVVVLVIVVAGYFYLSGGQGSYKEPPKVGSRAEMLRNLHAGSNVGGSASGAQTNQ